MKLSRVYRTTAILALAALSVTFARADEPAAPPADAGVIGSLSFASSDKVQDFAKLAGVPMPPFATPEGIEQAFTFIGNGKFDTASPVSLSMLTGKKLAGRQEMVFVLPVKKGGGDLSKLGDLKKTDAPDTMVTDEGFPFRKTDGYVMFGGTVPITSKIDAAALATAFKPSTDAAGKTVTPIAKMEIDVKEFKRVNPEQFNSGLSMSPNEKNPFSIRLHTFATEQVDKVNLDLNQVGDDYSLSARIAPMHVDMAKFEKAGLPKDLVMRTDMCLSAGTAKELLKPDKNSKMTETEEGEAALVEAIFLGDSESIGLSAANEGTLFDVVHHPHPGDLKAILQPIVAQLNTEKGPEAVSAELSEYKLTDGTSVVRIVAGKGDNKYPIYIDTVAKGDMIYTTASLSEEHQVEKLIVMKPEGMTNSIASGWIKVAETASLASAVTNKWMMKEPIPALPQEVVDAIGAKPVYWTADNDGDGMKAEVTLPLGVIKAIGMAVSGQ